MLKGPGDFSPPDPDPTYCEAIDCEHLEPIDLGCDIFKCPEECAEERYWDSLYQKYPHSV